MEEGRSTVSSPFVAQAQRLSMDERCRHDLSSQQRHSSVSDKQVRFGADPRSIDPRSESSQVRHEIQPDSEDPDESQEIQTAQKTDTMGAMDDMDDDMDEEEEDHMEMDPRIEEKIARIKNNYQQSALSGTDLTKDNTSASFPMTGANRSLNQPFSKNTSSLYHQPIDESEHRNVQRLEEVLKRQRERLENINGAFQQ